MFPSYKAVSTKKIQKQQRDDNVIVNLRKQFITKQLVPQKKEGVEDLKKSILEQKQSVTKSAMQNLNTESHQMKQITKPTSIEGIYTSRYSESCKNVTKKKNILLLKQKQGGNITHYREPLGKNQSSSPIQYYEQQQEIRSVKEFMYICDQFKDKNTKRLQQERLSFKQKINKIKELELKRYKEIMNDHPSRRTSQENKAPYLQNRMNSKDLEVLHEDTEYLNKDDLLSRQLSQNQLNLNQNLSQEFSMSDFHQNSDNFNFFNGSVQNPNHLQSITHRPQSGNVTRKAKQQSVQGFFQIKNGRPQSANNLNQKITRGHSSSQLQSDNKIQNEEVQAIRKNQSVQLNLGQRLVNKQKKHMSANSSTTNLQSQPLLQSQATTNNTENQRNSKMSQRTIFSAAKMQKNSLSINNPEELSSRMQSKEKMKSSETDDQGQPKKRKALSLFKDTMYKYVTEKYLNKILVELQDGKRSVIDKEKRVSQKNVTQKKKKLQQNAQKKINTNTINCLMDINFNRLIKQAKKKRESQMSNISTLQNEKIQQITLSASVNTQRESLDGQQKKVFFGDGLEQIDEDQKKKNPFIQIHNFTNKAQSEESPKKQLQEPTEKFIQPKLNQYKISYKSILDLKSNSEKNSKDEISMTHSQIPSLVNLSKHKNSIYQHNETDRLKASHGMHQSKFSIASSQRLHTDDSMKKSIRMLDSKQNDIKNQIGKNVDKIAKGLRIGAIDIHSKNEKKKKSKVRPETARKMKTRSQVNLENNIDGLINQHKSFNDMIKSAKKKQGSAHFSTNQHYIQYYL